MNDTNKRSKHILTDKTKNLAAKFLAQKIGYLRSDDLPGADRFESLPRLSFKPNRQIKSKDSLFYVRSGSVIISHAHHEYFIKDISPGIVFGNLPILGQTMLCAQAVAGSNGAMLSVMNSEAAKQWISEYPVELFEKIVPRFSEIEFEHYRSRFQLIDSKLAALILKLSAEGSMITGHTHAELGEFLGTYRETITNTLSLMELDGIIQVNRMKITILDKRALRELSEL